MSKTKSFNHRKPLKIGTLLFVILGIIATVHYLNYPQEIRKNAKELGIKIQSNKLLAPTLSAKPAKPSGIPTKTLILPTKAPQSVTAKTAANKIMNISYNEIDDYIKKLTGYTCTFPRGVVNFILDDNTIVVIGPMCGYQKIWRGVTFGFSDGTMRIMFLDGPVSGNPGTLNKGAMDEAIKILTTELTKSSMIVKESRWSKRFDLTTSTGLDEFMQFIYASFY